MANDGIKNQEITGSGFSFKSASSSVIESFWPKSLGDWVVLAGIFYYIIDNFFGIPRSASLSLILIIAIFFSIYILITKKGKFINIFFLLAFGFFDILLATQGGIISSPTLQSYFQSDILTRAYWPIWALLGILISRNEDKPKSIFTDIFIVTLVALWAMLIFGLVSDTVAYQDIKTNIESKIPDSPQKNLLADALGKEVFLNDEDINKAINTCFEKGRFLLIVAKAGLKNSNIVMNDECVKAELVKIKSQKTKTAVILAVDKKESQDKLTAEIYEEFSDYSENIKHKITARIDNSGDPLTAFINFETGATGATKPSFSPFNYQYRLLSVDVNEQNKDTTREINNIQDDVFVTFNTDLPRSEFENGKKLVYSVTIKDIETTGEFTLLFMDLAQLEQLKSNYVDQNQKKIREPVKGTLSDDKYNLDLITYHRNLFTFYNVPELIDTIYPFGLIGYKENKLGAISLDLIGKQPVIGAKEGREYTFILDVSNINKNLKPGISRIESLELETPNGIETTDCELKTDQLERTLKDNLFCTVTITDENILFNGRNPKEIFPPVPITFTAKMKFDYTIEKTIEITPLKAEP